MNLIQWLLTLPIRDAAREENRVDAERSLQDICYYLQDLAEQGKRNEAIGAVLEERDCLSCADLEKRIAKLELEWLHLSEVWGQYYPPTVTLLNSDEE